MVDKNKLIKITNRSFGSTGYTIPDLNNLHRTFNKDETKELPMEELRRLSWLPGGMVLLKECLVIHDEEARMELLGEVEPEYLYTKEDILELLEKGSLEQFLDFLDFAPEGAIKLMQDIAVKTELNDVKKRKAIQEKTGFNIDKAIYINVESQKEDEEPKTERRAAPLKSADEQAAPQRRTVPNVPKYNVVVK